MMRQQPKSWFMSLGMVLVLAACTSSTNAPTATTQKAKALSSTDKTRVNVAEKAPKAATEEGAEPNDAEYGTTALEVLFSRVLSRGFRQVSTRQNISKARCVTALQSLVSRGPTSVEFLTSKLEKGSLGERALALWSLGSMGEEARSAGRVVARAMARSWQVPIERCTKKGGDETACTQRIMAKPASWTITAGCRALKELNSLHGVRDVAQLGLSQQMGKPCLDAYFQWISTAEVRDRLIESWSVPKVADAVKMHLSKNPKAALSFALYWIRQEKVKANTTVCPLTEVLGPPTSSVMKALIGRLHTEELSALNTLRSEISQPSLNACLGTFLKTVGTTKTVGPMVVQKADADVQADTRSAFAVGDFCPADAQ